MNKQAAILCFALALQAGLAQASWAEDTKLAQLLPGPETTAEPNLGPTSPPGTMVPQPAAPVGTTGLVETVNGNGKPRFALTLAGGGAKGAAHIGVLKVLEREGIKPDFISGSSMGAIVGGLYSAGVPLSEIEQMFVSGEIKRAFFPLPLPLQLGLKTPTYLGARLLGFKPEIGLYNGKKVEKLIARHLPPTKRCLENFDIPFAAISCNLLDTRTVWVNKGDAARMIRASTAVPVLYKPLKVDGKKLVDGGLRANLPTDPAEAAGAPVIVAVKLHSSLEALPEQSMRKLFPYMDRILSIYLAEIEAKATGDANVLVSPNVGDMNIYSFDRASMVKAIAEGERAAQEQLPQIRAALRRETGTASKQSTTHE